MGTILSQIQTRFLLLIVIMAALIAIVACGGAAEDEATVAPAPTTAPTAMPEATVAAPAQATAVPTAMPEATEEAATPAPAGPEGTLNIAFKELFAFGNSPRLTESAVLVFVGSASGESMIKLNIDREMVPQLAAEWSVDDSGSVWTIKLQENVEFHKDWGNFTAADVVYTMNEYTAPEGITSWLGTLQRLFGAEGGGPTVVDEHTLTVDTVTPQFDFLYALILPEVIQTVSKANYEAEGQDVATHQGIGTGPWEFVEASTREFWKFSAVNDHYRKSPEFAELVLWDIPEEATRVANFETGQLDSFLMAFDSKPRLDAIPGIRYMSVPNGSTAHIGLHPNHYVGMGEPDYAERRPGAAGCLADGSCPWVSPNPDVNSPEWENAKMIREALLISVDRQEIVDTLLGGEGSPQSLWTWENRQEELAPDLREWEFNPEKARQLLADAGYPDGFDIEVTASIRGVAAEAESCEAVADYWEDIGIRTNINRVPYLSIGPRISAREYVGLSCHGTGGRIDPATVYSVIYSSESGFSGGFDHPIMEDLLDQMFGIGDDEGHWKIMNEMARFMYENALDSGFYSVNVLWPLSSQVESWREHLQQGDTRSLGSYEFVQHREE